MMWLLMWINKSVTTIDAMLQLLDIYRLQEILIVTRLTLKEYSVNMVSYFLQVITNGTIGPQQPTRPNPATFWGGSFSFFFTNCLQGCKKIIILMRKMRRKGREEREMEEKREKLIFFLKYYLLVQFILF